MPLKAMFPSNATSGGFSNQKRLKKMLMQASLFIIHQTVGRLFMKAQVWYGNTIIGASVSEPHTNEFNGGIYLIDYVRIVCHMSNAQVCMPCAGKHLTTHGHQDVLLLVQSRFVTCIIFIVKLDNSNTSGRALKSL